jgi:hypothetical protein
MRLSQGIKNEKKSGKWEQQESVNDAIKKYPLHWDQSAARQ